MEILGHLSLGTIDLLDLMFSGVGRMPRGELNKLKKRMNNRHNSLDYALAKLEDKQKFYQLLNKLQKDNLIIKDKDKNKSIWSLTQKGKNVFSLSKDKPKHKSPSTINYKVEPDNDLKIVIFDIPELEKFKRDWLRSALKNLDFTILQKSVFMGKNKLPKQFLEDLRELNLMRDVKIFSVKKDGNIANF